ncbi:MAG: DUF456 domain-containing protein [Rikenellaceae bacterium]
MDTILYIIALLCAVVGVLGALLPILPGPIISVVGLTLGYFLPVDVVSTRELIIWIAVCIVVSVVDYFLPIYMTKRLGGSKSGMVGATIGMVVGLIAFPPFGIVVGPFIGAVMGEISHNREDVGRAFGVGFGTFLAFIFGTGLKFVVTLWILWIMIESIYPFVESKIALIFDKIALL